MHKDLGISLQIRVNKKLTAEWLLFHLGLKNQQDSVNIFFKEIQNNIGISILNLFWRLMTFLHRHPVWDKRDYQFPTETLNVKR